MSTHIGNAFRFKHDDLALAVRQAVAHRPKAQKQITSYLAAKFARHCEYDVLMRNRFGEKSDCSPMVSAYREMTDRQRNNSMKTGRPASNWSVVHNDWSVVYNILLFDVPGAVLGMTQVTQAGWHTSVMRSLPVKSYDYQNQTDRPSHISAKEYAERSRMWDLAMPTGSISDSAISISMVSTTLPLPTVDQVFRKMRGREAFIAHHAERLVVNDNVAARSAALPRKPTLASVSAVLGLQTRAITWAKGAEGAQAIAEEAARLDACLPEWNVEILK